MAVQFVAASNQYLSNATARVTAVPFTVCGWAYFSGAAGGQYTLWSVEKSTDDNGWGLTRQFNDSIYFGCFSNSASGDAIAASGAIGDGWHFVAARAITAANRRVSALLPNGTISHGQNTTSVTPSGVTLEAHGSWPAAPGDYLNGRLAEWSLWNADVQADGGQLLDSTLRQMAYGGPFSLPHMMASLVEYRSFKNGTGSSQDKFGEVYTGGAGRQTWVNNNGATLGPHPPLPYWYAKPAQAPRALVV